MERRALPPVPPRHPAPNSRPTILGNAVAGSGADGEGLPLWWEVECVVCSLLCTEIH